MTKTKTKTVNLKKKPLVEAIFELRWRHEPSLKDELIDRNYRLLVGNLYASLKAFYPEYEMLPTADMPDEISAFIVQHRFRAKPQGWPLIQIGPGVLTLNDTENYTWDDFFERISRLTKTLFEIHPDPINIRITSLMLRYIDSIEFDFEQGNVFDFLRDKMKLDIKIYKKLFENTGINEKAAGFDLRFSFPSKKPEGTANIRFHRGKKSDHDSLFWDTVVLSSSEKGLGNNQDDINNWVGDAHNLTHDWFFKIIEGELERQFE